MKLIKKYQRGKPIFSDTPTGRAMLRQYDLEHGIVTQRVLPEVEVMPNPWSEPDAMGYYNIFSIPYNLRPKITSLGETTFIYTPKTNNEYNFWDRLYNNPLFRIITDHANVVPTGKVVKALGSMVNGKNLNLATTEILPKVIYNPSNTLPALYSIVEHAPELIGLEVPHLKGFPSYKSMALLAMKEAYAYKHSKEYRDLVERTNAEYFKDNGKYFDTDLFFPKIIETPPKVSFKFRDPGKLGVYRYKSNSIEIDPIQGIGEAVPYHEHLHHLRLGHPESSAPKYLTWLYNTDNNKSAALFNEYYSDPIENSLVLEENNVSKWLQKKVNKVMESDAPDYINSPEELAVHGLEAGKLLGIKPFTPMPNDPKLLDAMITLATYKNSWLDYVLHSTPLDKKNFWDILTGNFIPGITGPVLGAIAIDNNKNETY